MMATEFRLTSTTNVTVTDSHSPGGRTVGMSAGFYRIFLGSATGLGTRAVPWEFLSRFQTALNAAPGSTYYEVSLRPDGLVQIYRTSAGSGASSIAGTSILRLLGFNSTVNFVSPDKIEIAPFHPQFVLYSICLANDSGWTSRAPMAAVAETLDGRVTGWAENTVRVSRSFDLRFHPRDADARLALSTAGTIIEPPKSRWKEPATAIGSTLHWSVRDFMQAAAFKRVAFALNNFQTYVTTALDSYDVGFFTEASINSDKAIVPTTANWSQRCDWRGVEIVFYETGTRV
jgi:hypothetical protein